MNIPRSSSGTLPATNRRKKSLAKRLYSFGSLPSLFLFSKRALLNERSLPHEVIPYFYPANLPLDLQMIVVGAIFSLSEMLNDFACRLDQDEDEADEADAEACEQDSESSSQDDNDDNHEDDDDDDSSKASDDDTSRMEDIQSSFRILALDGFKVAVWDELCDGVLLHRTGSKRPKGDICLVKSKIPLRHVHRKKAVNGQPAFSVTTSLTLDPINSFYFSYARRLSLSRMLSQISLYPHTWSMWQNIYIFGAVKLVSTIR